MTKLMTFLLLFSFSTLAAEPKLIVSPENHVVLDPLTVKVTNVPHGAMVEIQATYSNPRGKLMRSSATFFADDTGIVDVAKDYSTHGTYEGVESHGLIWSAKEEGEAIEENVRESYEDIEITYTAKILNLMNPEKTVTLSANQTSRFRAENIAREEVNESNLRGVLFYPKDVPSPPTLMILSGSDGGVYESDAALFATRGFAALALAGHNYKDRPEALMNTPLEYWLEGMNFLSNRFSDGKVSIMGTSRGGELALLLGSVWPEMIDAVVSIVPSNVVWNGCCTPESFGQPAFTLNGEPVKATGYPDDMAPISFQEGASYPNSERGYYIQSMLNPEKYGGAIEVEKINAPIMLIAGQADRLWPSDVAVRKVAERLQQNNFSHEVVVHIYPAAGHSAGIPGYNFTKSIDWTDPDNPDFKLPLGGTVAGNAKAAIHSHVEQLSFLRKNAVHQKVAK